jgi:hypothetical protein
MKKQEKELLTDKFNYILDYHINAIDAQNAFGYNSANMIYKLRHKDQKGILTQPHIELLECRCKIPKEVFSSSIPFNPNDPEKKDHKKIDKIIATYHKMLEADRLKILNSRYTLNNSHIFYENQKLLELLTGVWYGYFYPSNQHQEIWSIKTTITPNGEVLDESNNRGQLLLGKKQSIIIKETDNSKNLVSITFTNSQVGFELFYFSLVSKQNHLNKEMFNFGFYSRKKLTLEIAKEILGEKEKLQLKMDYTFHERVCEYVEIIKKI